MDKYIEILQEPKYNCMINLKLLEKETLCKWYKTLKYNDHKRVYRYKLEPVSIQKWTKKPKTSKYILKK
jgi:hypothetical protein